MMRKIVLVLALGAISLPSGAAGVPEPETLKRADKWVAKFDRDSCHLMAQFGTGDDAVIARFTRFEPGNGFQLTLYGKRLPKNGDREDAKIDFGLGVPTRKEVMLGKAGNYPTVFFGGLRLDGWQAKTSGQEGPEITPKQEAAVSTATVTIRGKTFRLGVGSMAKPMETMRTCLTDLLKSWGYDPEVQTALSREVTPINSPGRWLESSDYPLPSLFAGHNGSVQFRLDVDEQGKVAGCYVLERTSPDDFADITCKAVSKRAKLMPALDAKGKPVRSYYVQHVQWLAG